MRTVFVLSCMLLVLETTTIQATNFDNALYANFLCRNKVDGFRGLVPGSCLQYYECENGKSELHLCPRFYDPVNRICVINNPGCVETISAPAGCIGECCGILSGMALDPLDSQVYYECYNNCVVAKNTCPDDLVYNLIKSECASPASCSSDI